MRASPDGVARDSMDDQPAFIPLVVAATQVAWALLLWSFLRDNCYLRAGWPIVVGGLCVVPRAWAQDVLDTGGAAADLMVFKGLAPAWWLPVIRAMLIVGIVRVVLESKSRHAGLAMHQRKRVGGGGCCATR